MFSGLLAVQAQKAQHLYSTFTQEQVDTIFKAAAQAASAARIDLAVQVGLLLVNAAHTQGPAACNSGQQHAVTFACTSMASLSGSRRDHAVTLKSRVTLLTAVFLLTDAGR